MNQPLGKPVKRKADILIANEAGLQILIKADDPMRDQVWDQVRDPVFSQVYSQVCTQVCTQLDNQVLRKSRSKS